MFTLIIIALVAPAQVGSGVATPNRTEQRFLTATDPAPAKVDPTKAVGELVVVRYRARLRERPDDLRIGRLKGVTMKGPNEIREISFESVDREGGVSTAKLPLDEIENLWIRGDLWVRHEPLPSGDLVPGSLDHPVLMRPTELMAILKKDPDRSESNMRASRAATGAALLEMRATEAREKERDRLRTTEARTARIIEESMKSAPVRFRNETGRAVLIVPTAFHDEEGERVRLFQGNKYLRGLIPLGDMYQDAANLYNVLWNPNNPIPAFFIGKDEERRIEYRGKSFKTSYVGYLVLTEDGQGDEQVETHDAFNKPFEIRIPKKAVHPPIRIKQRDWVTHRDSRIDPAGPARPTEPVGGDSRCKYALGPAGGAGLKEAPGWTSMSSDFVNPTDRALKVRFLFRYPNERLLHAEQLAFTTVEFRVPARSSTTLTIAARPESFDLKRLSNPPLYIELFDFDD